MSAPMLSVGCGGYDRTRPLQDGRAGVDGYTLDIRVMTPSAVVAASYGSGELDIAEISTGSLAMRADQGIGGYVGIPAFVSMALRHDCIYVPAAGARRRPTDLDGARVGIGDFAGTSGIWVRGMLQDQFGVDLRSIRWVFGPTDTPAPAAKAATVVSGFTAVAAPEGSSLVDLLRRGQLDCIISLRVPKPFAARDGLLVRLFDDLPAVEATYVQSLGAPPALHPLALKQTRADADPSLPRKLLESFTKAKDVALAELRDTTCYHASLPMLAQMIERAEATVGSDFFPYGLERHRKGIEAFCRYCHEQGLTSRRIGIAELFPHFA